MIFLSNFSGFYITESYAAKLTVFYYNSLVTVKWILLFVAASLMLVGSTIAVVIPTLLKRTQTLHDAKILVALSALASTKKSSVKDP